MGIKYCLGLLWVALTLQVCGQPTAEEIMDHSREVTRFKGLESVMTLHILNDRGSERIRKIAMASRSEGEVEKRIIKFLEPADVKGTGLLIFDYKNKSDDMWMYLPALRKVRRIVSADQGKSFMGSEFSNADMAAPNLKDFSLEKTGEAEIDGVSCYMITMKPVNDDLVDSYGFARKVVYVGKQDYVMRKAVYFDTDNEKVKTLTAENIRPVADSGGKLMTRHMEMVNHQNKRKSWIEVLTVQYNPEIDPSLFTTTYLSSH